MKGYKKMKEITQLLEQYVEAQDSEERDLYFEIVDKIRKLRAKD